MTEILKGLSAMTPQWLEEALGQAGFEPPTVTALEVAPMDGFVGAMGEVGVVNVDYGSETDLPSGFVAKCPLDDDLARLYAAVMLSYQREAGFYADLADQVPMTVPACYVNLFDPETHNATLLIEHISPAEKGDILSGTSFGRLHRLMGDLARMHGRFWSDAGLSGLDWFIDWNEPNLLTGIPMTVAGWHDYQARYPDRYPKDLAGLISSTWITDTQAWLARFAERPSTLIHQDYELDNMLFRGHEPVICDWQTAMWSFPGIDVSWFLACSHTDRTRERERELLDFYRAELAAAGGPDWSAQQLAEDLAWGAYYWASVSVTPYMHTVDAGAQDRPHRRFTRMLDGVLDVAIRWNVVDIVGEA